MGRIHKLTVVGIGRLNERGMHSDGGGLFLNMGEGRRSWIFRFTQADRRREMGLGPYPAVSLADAREKAAEYRRQVAAGIDPINARQVKRQAAAKKPKNATFAQCARRYVDAKQHEWRSPKTLIRWERLLRYADKAFGEKPVGEVCVDDVMELLEPLWMEKAETASKLREAVECILDYSMARGLRQGENPARWRGHLSYLLPAHGKAVKVEHHQSLPWPEAPRLAAELVERHAPSARALLLTLLTACRSGEILQADWAEIDLASGIWTIPAGRTKQNRIHRVPLSQQAVNLFRDLSEYRVSRFVFQGMRRDRPISDMSMLMWLRKNGWAHRTTPHGLRSTFRTWAAEATDCPRELAEAALGHVIGDEVERAYMRGELLAKRRELMQHWANFCDAERG